MINVCEKIIDYLIEMTNSKFNLDLFTFRSIYFLSWLFKLYLYLNRINLRKRQRRERKGERHICSFLRMLISLTIKYINNITECSEKIYNSYNVRVIK